MPPADIPGCKWEVCKSQSPIEHHSELYQASTCWNVLYGFFVFSWLEHWHPSQFPWGRTNFFSDMWASLWLQTEGVVCICLGQLVSLLFSLSYQLKCPKHLPASLVLLLFPTVFFFFPSKVKHRSFCFMLHQLSGLPPFTPTTNWSKWKGTHLLKWDWLRRPTPAGSVGALCEGDSVSFCNLATLPGRSFKGWGP